MEVGEVSEIAHRLNAATKFALDEGIASMKIGNRLSDISASIEGSLVLFSQSNQCDEMFCIVDDFGGHGIGTSMHQDPYLPNVGEPGRGPHIILGSVLAIEPMLAHACSSTRVDDDEWTVRMSSNRLSAHWEHTVVATEAGPLILSCDTLDHVF